MTTESWGCTQGKLLAIIVSKVPTMVSLPPLSWAKSQNVKISVFMGNLSRGSVYKLPGLSVPEP
jgi:hypothetical protein